MTASAWVRPTEAAEILGIPRKTLYRQIEAGIIPRSAIAPRLPGQRSILISRKWLMGQDATPITAITSRLSDAEVNRIAVAVCDEMERRAVARAYREVA